MKKTLLLNLRYLLLGLLLGLINVVKSNAQIDTSLVYYVLHQTDGNTMGENSSNSAVLFAPNKDDAAQQIKFANSPVAGQYYIKNKKGHYLYRVDNNSWDVKFSADTSTSTNINHYRFIISSPDVNGAVTINAAYNSTTEFLGTDKNTVGSALYGNKTSTNAVHWKILTVDQVTTFVESFTVSELNVINIEKGLKVFPFYVIGINVMDTVSLEASGGFSIDKNQILPSEFVAGGGKVNVNVNATTAVVGDTGKLIVTKIQKGSHISVDTSKVTVVLPFKRYNIYQVASNLVIGSQSTDPTIPALTTPAGLPSQRFFLRPVHPGTTDSIYYIVQDFEYRYFTKITANGYDTKLGTLEQGIWQVKKESGGFYSISNTANSGKYLASDAVAVDSRLYADKSLNANAQFQFVGLAKNDTLSDLKVNGTTVTSFDPGTITYAVELPSGTTQVPAVTWATKDTSAAARVTNASLLPGSTKVLVTAADGTTQLTYTINFTVKASDTDATLKALTVSAGILLPVFDANTLKYTVTLPYGTTTVPTITAMTNATNATSVITAAATLSDTTKIKVTAQDGTTTMTYAVVFEVTPASTDATLKTLTVSAGTLSPTFIASTFKYTVTLPYGTTAVPTVTVTKSDVNAQNPIVTAAATMSDTTKIKVTAQDGTTTMTYAVAFQVTPGSNDATLKTLTVSAGTLSPTFIASTFKYTVTLPYGTTVVPSLTVTKNDVNAQDPVVTAAATLSDTTKVKITAQDGTTTLTYAVAFKLAPASTDAALKALTVSTGTLSPTFSASTLKYIVNLPKGTTTVPTITATKNDANAQDPVITGAATLSDTTKVKVVAQDGTTSKIYLISFKVLGTGVTTLIAVDVKVYPNPVTDGNAKVVVGSYDKDSYITVFSVNGAIVLTKKIVSLETEINFEGLPAGTYFIKVFTTKGTSTVKISKQ